MKKEILIFQHFPTEGPGYFARFLDRQGIPHRTLNIDEGEPVPESIADIPGLVLMGGPMSVNDPLPWIPKVLQLIRAAVAADIPVLGHCLGGQLLSKALGGRVRASRAKEFGWLPVTAVGSPLTNAWLDGLPPQFEVFHWHGETFSIPPGATHLLRSRYCRNQAFVIGKSLGLQCHIEMTPELVRAWARDGAGEIARALPAAGVQRPAQMLINLPERAARLNRVADVLYTRWVQGLKY
ncbi:MAG: type 1 glutamine amidotransferase [Pseudomonadota bacterium]